MADVTTSATMRRAMPPWSQEVRQRALELSDSLRFVPDGQVNEIKGLIHHAERLASERAAPRELWARIREWWYGSRVEQAWACLHEAQARTVEYASDEYVGTTGLESALTMAEVLDPNDPIRIRLDTYVRSLPAPGGPGHVLNPPSPPAPKAH